MSSLCLVASVHITREQLLERLLAHADGYIVVATGGLVLWAKLKIRSPKTERRTVIGILVAMGLLAAVLNIVAMRAISEEEEREAATSAK